jgi:hypothetical protein
MYDHNGYQTAIFILVLTKSVTYLSSEVPEFLH